MTVKLWSSPSVVRRPALSEIFSEHRFNFYFRRIPFAHSSRLLSLRGSPSRSSVASPLRASQ